MVEKTEFFSIVQTAFEFLERDFGFKLLGIEGHHPEFWVTYAAPDDCKVIVSAESGSRPWVEVSFPTPDAGSPSQRTNASLLALVRAESEIQQPETRESVAYASGVGSDEVDAILADAELLRENGRAVLSGEPSARARVSAEAARTWRESQN